jgi:hypothetical protein
MSNCEQCKNFREKLLNAYDSILICEKDDINIYYWNSEKECPSYEYSEQTKRFQEMKMKLMFS